MMTTLKRFWAWLIYLPEYPEEPQPLVLAQPAVFQPRTAEQVEFFKWRAGHIDRWLADPDNADHPGRGYLTAERDMHLAALRMKGY